MTNIRTISATKTATLSLPWWWWLVFIKRTEIGGDLWVTEELTLFLCLSCPPCPALYFYPSNALHSTCVVVRISMKNDTNNAHKTCADIAVSNCWKGKFNILQRPPRSLYKHSAKFYILWVVIQNCVENRSGGGGFR